MSSIAFDAACCEDCRLGGRGKGLFKSVGVRGDVDVERFMGASELKAETGINTVG